METSLIRLALATLATTLTLAVAVAPALPPDAAEFNTTYIRWCDFFPKWPGCPPRT